MRLIVTIIRFSSIATIFFISVFALSEGCDSSYPYTCIPSPPPDLNCSDIHDNNFRVLSSDPH